MSLSIATTAGGFHNNLHGNNPWGEAYHATSNNNIIELIIGALVFLSIVAIYNALFAIWQRLFGQSQESSEVYQEIPGGNDVFIRVTYAAFVCFVTFVTIRYFDNPRGRFPRFLPNH